jgi:hypothetical protein
MLGSQALALESLASPPSWIVLRGCHPKVRAFIDYEALEDVLDFFLSLGVDHWVYEPNGWSLGWMENSSNVFMFCPRLSFFDSFHSKLLLSHLFGTFIVSMSKFVYHNVGKNFVKQD